MNIFSPRIPAGLTHTQTDSSIDLIAYEKRFNQMKRVLGWGIPGEFPPVAFLRIRPGYESLSPAMEKILAQL